MAKKWCALSFLLFCFMSGWLTDGGVVVVVVVRTGVRGVRFLPACFFVVDDNKEVEKKKEKAPSRFFCQAGI